MKVHFVLVEPKVPENIGASARAIKTMGFNSLSLINPLRWNESKTLWLAHGSGEILKNAVIYSSLNEAVKDSDFVIATTAKVRSVKHDYIPSENLADFIRAKAGSINNLSIVFGREESGLTNEEMKLCDISSRISMARSYPSLNLSQAVMVYAYELSVLNLDDNKEEPEVPDENSIKALKVKIRKLLFKTGIDEDDNRFGRIMERVSSLEQNDVNLLHSICNLIVERTEDQSDC
jgi:tRNA/rRNA methyltransferase